MSGERWQSTREVYPERQYVKTVEVDFPTRIMTAFRHFVQLAMETEQSEGTKFANLLRHLTGEVCLSFHPGRLSCFFLNLTF